MTESINILEGVDKPDVSFDSCGVEIGEGGFYEFLTEGRDGLVIRGLEI